MKLNQIKIIVKKGHSDTRVFKILDNEEQIFELDSMDIREKFTVKILTQDGEKITWAKFFSENIPDNTSMPPYLFRDFNFKELGGDYTGTAEIMFLNVLRSGPALTVGMNNKSKISVHSRKIESARPGSALSKSHKSRPVSSITTGYRGPSMKPLPQVIQKVLTGKNNIAEFNDIPIGKYLIQFDGHSFLKPFTREIEVDVNDEREIRKEIKVNMIDEAYVILYPADEDSKGFNACLYPVEKEGDFHSMPIEMSKMGEEYMAVVEPGDYWVFIDYGSGGFRIALSLDAG